MSSLFDEETIRELKHIFDEHVKRNLRDILVIDSKENPGNKGCSTCPEAKLLAEEITRISGGKVAFDIKTKEEAKAYRPRYLPVFIYDTKAKNIRYYGIPSGQEFAPFIFIHEYITSSVKLSSSIIEEIEPIETPLHIKVFVTPECPYCPIVVDFVNQVGVINENILVETIEAFENPQEADMYGVQYVPFIAINRIEDYDKYGARPVEVVPGYMPPEDIVKIIKRSASKIKKSITRKSEED